MKGIFKRSERESGKAQRQPYGATSGAEDEQERLSIVGALGFEPPRRGAGPLGRNGQLKEPERAARDRRKESAQALDHATADAVRNALAELRRLKDRLERTEANTRALAEAERRIEDAERRAAAAWERRLVAALEEQRLELESEAMRQVEEARGQAKREGQALLRTREHELRLEFGAIETELATAREQLGSAEERVASLERRRFQLAAATDRSSLAGELDHAPLPHAPSLPS